MLGVKCIACAPTAHVSLAKSSHAWCSRKTMGSLIHLLYTSNAQCIGIVTHFHRLVMADRPFLGYKAFTGFSCYHGRPTWHGRSRPCFSDEP